jgi:prepilin-type N-terminal cleavage/methylation domain-containing protein
MRTQKSAGFTLIEISIVLVIIGLIVGGVLVGRDMIQAAAIRSQVAQIEKYNAAVNTFRAKYNAVPGDMIPALATTFGLFALSNPSGLRGMGDNSGTIEDGGGGGANCGTGGANANFFCGEISVFWRHLSDANLVDGQYGATGNSVPQADNGIPTAAVSNVAQSMPPAKIGRGMFVTVISGRGTNYYGLLPILVIGNLGSYTLGTKGITPTESSNIDSKIDDGQPETGAVVALGLNIPFLSGAYGSNSTAELIGGAPPSSAATSTLNKCVISSDSSGALATDTYNLVPSTGGNDPSCALAIRFQ